MENMNRLAVAADRPAVGGDPVLIVLPAGQGIVPARRNGLPPPGVGVAVEIQGWLVAPVAHAVRARSS